MLIFLFQMRKYYFSPTMVLDANPSVPYYHLPNPDKPVVAKWKFRSIGEAKKSLSPVRSSGLSRFFNGDPRGEQRLKELHCKLLKTIRNFVRTITSF